MGGPNLNLILVDFVPLLYGYIIHMMTLSHQVNDEELQVCNP